MSNARDDGGESKGVLIVDDHPIVRQGVRMLIEQQEDLHVVAEAESAAEALRALSDAPADVAVVDLTLKESSGLELIKDIRSRWPDVCILVLSMRDEAFYAERCLRAGARGYVTKEQGPTEVIEGIRSILAGKVHLSESMAAKVLSKFAGAQSGATSLTETLTDRELEIYQLIGSGLTTREISERLHVSPKTVDSHREHIKDKLGLDTANDLLKHAIHWMQQNTG
ncbi:MAG: response regulator transcription factor [Phycisphaerae bacterium]|nr:response regulator transcription factor [Phycisphaerae bacterium]